MKLPRIGGFYFLGPGNGRKKAVILAGCGALAVMLIVIFIFTGRAYSVSVDGRVIGNIKSRKAFEKIKRELMSKYSSRTGADVAFDQDIKLTPVRAFGQKVDKPEELAEKLDSVLSVLVRAVAIDINNAEVAVVKDKATAEAVLQGVKEYYVSRTPGELMKIEVADSVKLIEKFTDPEKVLTPDAAKQLILKGAIEMKNYKVKQGDTLWSIAKEQNIPLDELIKANPQLESEDRLALGEVINLRAVKPLLNVTVVKKVTYREPIPYKTQIVRDDSLWKWDQKVKQPGQNGTREVAAQAVYKNGVKVSQTVLGEKVLKEPVDRIVARGTRAQVAFRGSGRFLWPAVGRITSPFGRRGREFHTGIDVANDKGAPVRAANSGVVTFTGSRGGYGKLVIVDHGGGFETYYAHLNSIDVSTGDRVEKGQKIGAVGTTGRTTGPHVHFEVRLNGVPQNPINYLNK
ncbi:peptidoglycan DD-metalloendopeptidase family protein [Thermoanaerobacterium sp. DL9XJH110]|uniref:peptidoglycan DD-metalloendopeptidase family protein n=1 Tax=Thermoanaerobacterium sp. DL9XJH110 TaxID=3386643 RepID=UPI003BB6D7A7